VRGVTNKITVCVRVDPERIKFLIEEVLERRADRQAGRLWVKADDGEVTLTGAVGSWEEKKAILGAVSHAPGVTGVNDQLIIEPFNLRFQPASFGAG
jgi:osmotically-inducible protein OsmY